MTDEATDNRKQALLGMIRLTSFTDNTIELANKMGSSEAAEDAFRAALVQHATAPLVHALLYVGDQLAEKPSPPDPDVERLIEWVELAARGENFHGKRAATEICRRLRRSAG